MNDFAFRVAALHAMGSDANGHLDLEAESLDHDERQCLMDVLDASLRVLNLQHYFAWTQGVVQTLLLHEILVCAVAGGEEGMRYYRFSSSRYFNDAHFAAVTDAESGLLPAMISHWERTNRPCLIGASHRAPSCDPAWFDLLWRHELRNAAAQGVRSADGSVKSFFCFSRLPEPFHPRLPYLLNILVPFMDATLNRVMAHEERTRQRPRPPLPPITPREVQILRWIRDGRTNQEIAHILQISPHTVKNHVRKILLKLGVQSRGQAAVRAIQLGVLKMRQD